MNELATLQASAYFWDGTNKLPGTLELWPTELVFQFTDFQQSHLDLRIPLEEIELVEIFMVFNLAKNGLKIISQREKNWIVLY